MIALLSVLLLASETPAAVAPSTDVPAAEAPKEEKKICKREGSTESRLGSKRICLTAAEWKARDTGEIEYRRNIKD
jgi:hypothetical protein